jgi:hypothetical protein
LLSIQNPDVKTRNAASQNLSATMLLRDNPHRDVDRLPLKSPFTMPA